MIFYAEFLILNLSTEQIKRIYLPVKDSNIFALNVGNNFLRREGLLKTKGQYMKDSNSFVGIAADFFSKGKTFLTQKESTRRRIYSAEKRKCYPSLPTITSDEDLT